MQKASVYIPKKFSVEWWARKVALGLGLISTLPLLGLIVGTQFVPSVGWVSYAFWISVPIAVLVGFTTSSAVKKNWRLQKTEAQMRRFPLFNLFLVSGVILIVGIGLPVGTGMAYSTLVREPVQHEFVIAQSDFVQAKYCQRGIKLRDLPILFDLMCHAQPSMEFYVTNGRKITLVGNGSRLGVFPQEILFEK